jgi:hypothetical protein
MEHHFFSIVISDMQEDIDLRAAPGVHRLTGAPWGIV